MSSASRDDRTGRDAGQSARSRSREAAAVMDPGWTSTSGTVHRSLSVGDVRRRAGLCVAWHASEMNMHVVSKWSRMFGAR